MTVIALADKIEKKYYGAENMKHTPQEERKAETKKKLVESAMKLFSTKGYYQTNSKEIAEGAGLAVGSFYRHFADKMDILKFILNSYFSNAFSDEITDEDTIKIENRKDIFQKLIRRGFELHQFTPGFYQQITLLSATDEEIGLVFNEYRKMMVSRIKNLIMASAPKLSPEKCETACTIIYAAIEGTIHAVKFSAVERDESLYISQLTEFIESFLSTTVDH